jgi:Ser/Thr protein kinase RdoA (MazF antagonist)
VAALLKRQHQLAVDGFRDVPVMPADILAQGDQFLAQMKRPQDLRRLRPSPVDCPVLLRRSLLHTDVGPGNLILGAQGLRLIDWQCPALGDAAEDLCAFLSPAFQILYGRAPLTPAQRAAFLFVYDDQRVVERLQLLEPFYHWRMATYCGMRQQQYAANRSEAAAAYAKALTALSRLLEN